MPRIYSTRKLPTWLLVAIPIALPLSTTLALNGVTVVVLLWIGATGLFYTWVAWVRRNRRWHAAVCSFAFALFALILLFGLIALLTIDLT